jgi:hypothetical protein
MPGQYDQFRCPLCGQHAPVDRVMTDEPFELQQFRLKFGGKRKLTEEQKLDRRRKEVYRGSAPGYVDYQPVRLSAKLRSLVTKRIQQLNDMYRAP